jgi:hypothetical protein
MQSQTKAYINKSSYEISALLRYNATLSGNYLPQFQDNLSVPSSRVKKSKRENREQLKLTDTISQITEQHGNSYLLRYASENKSSPRAVTGKWLSRQIHADMAVKNTTIFM